MTPNARRRKGRPPAAVRGPNGRTIPNLSATPYKYKVDKDGKNLLDQKGKKQVDCWRYFVTGTKPPVWLGFDLETAMKRLRRWEAQRQDHEVVVRKTWETLDEPMPEAEAVAYEFETAPDRFVSEDRRSIFSETAVTLSDLATAFRDVMADLERRKEFCALLPEFPLDRLHELPEAEASKTLTEIGDFYFKEKRISAQWRYKATQMWAEFKESLGVRLVREVTLEHIRRYKQEVLSAKTDDGEPVSPTYIRHRFGNVKTVLKYALDNGFCPRQIRAVLDYCGVLEKPDAEALDPKPISSGDFAALLQAADTKWRAVLLCALNFCMYPGEVAALDQSNVQLDKGTLIARRPKTKVDRVAVLWPRTIEYIRKYQADFPHQAKPLFVSHQGSRYVTNHIGKNFRKIRNLAGLPDDLKFEQIRDGAYSAAVENMSPQVGQDVPTNARLLAGHSVGMADHYVKRRPRMVKDACEAIWRYYGEAIEQVLGEADSTGSEFIAAR